MWSNDPTRHIPNSKYYYLRDVNCQLLKRSPGSNTVETCHSDMISGISMKPIRIWESQLYQFLKIRCFLVTVPILYTKQHLNQQWIFVLSFDSNMSRKGSSFQFLFTVLDACEELRLESFFTKWAEDAIQCHFAATKLRYLSVRSFSVEILIFCARSVCNNAFHTLQVCERYLGVR